MTRRRRGFAMLAALWLVVAIATVALVFSTEAHEHRALGIGTSDRGTQRAAAEGALAVVRGRLEQVLRDARVSGNGASALRAADPWLDADTLFGDTLRVGGILVHVDVRDLGAMLPVNTAAEGDLRNCIAYVLGDQVVGDRIAQAIADWIDADSIPRVNGGERDAYIAAGRLVLPPNRPVRDVDELRDVLGMKPEILDVLRPLLTTTGSGRVNVNSAPAAVLKGVPGLSDDIIARILAMRTTHQRVTSIASLFATTGGAAQRGRAIERQLQQRVTYNVQDLEVSVTVLDKKGTRARDASPTLRAVIQRSGGIAWETW